MTVKTKNQISAEIEALLADNATGSITPSILRQRLHDIIDSLAGAQIIMLPGAPNATYGVLGDYWLDQTSGRFYGPKGATEWPADYTSLIGPIGNAGATGATGAASTVPGPTGATGATGPASTVPGPTGAAGNNGAAVISYASTAAGIAATSSGGYFGVVQAAPNANIVDVYLNTAGTAVYQNSYPSIGSISTPLMNAGLVVAETLDSAGSVLVGDAVDGRRFASSYGARPRLSARRVGKQEQIFVSDNLGSTQLTFLGNNTEPEWLLGGTIRFMSDRNGVWEMWSMYPDGSNQANAKVILQHWHVTGQSLSIGANTAINASGGLALTTTNQNAQALMWQITGGSTPYGPRPLKDASPPTVNAGIDPTKLTAFTPLLEALQTTYGETVCSGFMSTYLKNASSSVRTLVDCLGTGSASWHDQYNSGGTYVGPGSVHFANEQISELLAQPLAEAQGWGYTFAGIIDLHGEADAISDGTSPGNVPTTRAGWVVDEQEKWALHNALGHTDSLYHRQKRMYVRQLSSILSYQPNAFGIACGNVDAALANPAIVVPVAGYPYNHGDDVHMDAYGQRHTGEQIGKWARRIEHEGQDLKPFVCFRTWRSGAAVYCQFYVPVLPIQIRTDLGVAAVANAGVTYADDSASGITVSSVAVYSADTLLVTLSSSSLGANPRLNFAGVSTGSTGPMTGARTNICDSDLEVGPLSKSLLTNWALHWQANIS